ncbi:MAG: cell division protein FtsX [Halomonadaceae bacterium]|nr:MAG: cell division protein FtsX [Halomonadaceae bacterium]
MPPPPPRRRGAAQARGAWREQLDSYLQHHRTSARDSADRLYKAPLSSMMTGMVIAIALALPVVLLLVLASVQQLSGDWQDTARIAVYLADDTGEEQARELQQQWQARDELSEVVFIHRDQALEDFREQAGLQDALEYLDSNPLPHTLIMTPAQDYRQEAVLEALMASLESLDQVAQVQLDMAWLQRLNAIAELMRQAVLVLGLLLGVAVVLVIGNSIRMAIENRRSEILVVKLVGGSDTFVRRPFLYTGLWSGLLGGLLAWWLVEVALWWLSAPVDQLAALYHSDFSLLRLPFSGLLSLLAVAMGFGWLGSWLAVKRHLRLIEPR